MWNLGNNTDEHRGKKKREREASCKRLLMIKNKLRVMEGVGGEWTKWMMGIKVATCYDEHWVYVTQ